jgi:putative restriction endonuclease
LLRRASSLEPIDLSEIEAIPAKRRQIIQNIRRMSRDARFRQQVLNAYGNRCAITRMQLKLVESAHILPVGSPESYDHVTNGLALSPTYHRAFDNGLIFLDTTYTMRINPEKSDALVKLNLQGGLQIFKASLGKIHLPADKRQWPNLKFVEKANKYRQIAV